MKPQTLKRIIAMLTNVASSDQARYNLACLRIEAIPDQPRYKLIATDGHIMAICEIEDASLDGVKEAHISRDMIPYLKSVSKLWKHGIPNCSATSDSLTIDGKLVSCTDVKFPNYQQIIPKFQESIKIGLDADLLLALTKGLGDKSQCSLEIKFTRELNNKGILTDKYIVDKLSPILVKSMGSDSIGVIMPVRI